jgi:hypothetical protein
MACFIVPGVEAIVVTIVNQALKAKEKNTPKPASHSEAKAPVTAENTKIPFSRKLKWLSQMLWGGSFLLAFEHVWHGEVTPWFPFLTAASDPADAAEMLHEMSTAGVLMAVLVTLVWIGMVCASNTLEKRDAQATPAAD